MDVDRFKQVNDTLGHSAGDELLRQVADRLNEALRPGDAVARVNSDMHTAARIGGDEFVIVLEGIRQSDDATQVADRLLHDLSQPYQLGSNAVHVSVSIGIVGAEQAGDDAGAVLRDCDTAMYEAKRAGRGRWMLFDASMHERVRSALEMEGELRRALAEDELYVVYQPVVDLADAQMTGVEALVRWRHPVRGEVSPGQFIGLAEECGLIDAIGDVVLHKACAQFALWQRDWGERAPRLLAVNLSRAQLKQPGLVPEVKAVLDANGMRPSSCSWRSPRALRRRTIRSRPCCGHSRPPACGWHWTTSAPATRRWPACTSCRWTRSRSTGRSCRMRARWNTTAC
jgi:diguanylate cyclase (GGDEF)-like protein